MDVTDLEGAAVNTPATPLVVVDARDLTPGNYQGEVRVDVRVMQVIYAVPPSEAFKVGQQVDAFIPARSAAAKGN